MENGTSLRLKIFPSNAITNATIHLLVFTNKRFSGKNQKKLIQFKFKASIPGIIKGCTLTVTVLCASKLIKMIEDKPS